MANEIPNAVQLMKDSDFRDWVCAASAQIATQVIASAGSTAASKAMGSAVLLTPRGPILDRLVSIIATRPSICSVGTTVGEQAGAIGQALLLTEVASVWSALANLLYPTP